MGAILEQYLSSFGQALSQLSAPPGGQPGAGRRGTGPVMPGPQPPQGAPSFPPGEGGGVAAAPPSASFELPMLPGESPEQHQAQFDRSVGQTFETAAPTQLEAAPAPTFEQPELAQIDTSTLPERKGPMNIEDVKTPEDMFAAASPEQLEGGIKALEGVLEEQGTSLDEAYENMTGGPPDTRLTREEKGTLLMEFGLGILAQGAMEGEGLAAIGASGLSTLQSAREMKEEKRTRPARERKEQLEMDLTEAQIAAAQRTDKEITTDKDGNMIIVDVESGKTITVKDAQGNPVAAGADTQRKFEKEVSRDMYRAVRCTGKEGAALERCETAALAYAAGGAGVTLAFPEIMDRENTEAALRVLLDDDARFTQHLIPSSGERKTISEMTGSERAEVVRETAKLWGIQEDVKPEDESTPPGWNASNIGITQEEARGITLGNKVPHPSGIGWIANRNGHLVRLDENNEVMEGE